MKGDAGDNPHTTTQPPSLPASEGEKGAQQQEQPHLQEHHEEAAPNQMEDNGVLTQQELHIQR